MNELKWIRAEWARICNQALPPDAQISEKSLAAQGIRREPGRHLGPARSRKIKKELEATRAEIARMERERKRQEAAAMKQAQDDELREWLRKRSAEIMAANGETNRGTGAGGIGRPGRRN